MAKKITFRKRSRLVSLNLYVNRGWSLIPVRSKDKRPQKTWKDYQSRRASIREIETWFPFRGSINLGLVTGAISKAVVLDIDPRHGGNKSFELLIRRFGALPFTLSSRTGGGGRHIFLRHPGIRIKSGPLSDYPGIDIKADGGFVVIPPSVHPSGNHYEWLCDPSTELAAMPKWLIDLLSQKESPSEKAALAGADGEIKEGARNETLTKVAGKLRCVGLEEEVIFAALQAFNEIRCTPPLPEAELQATAASMMKYPPEFDSFTHIVPKAKESKAITAWDLIESDSPDLDWMLEGLVAGSLVSLFSAHPKVGKTTLLYHMLKGFLEETSFLDRPVSFVGNILLLSEEPRPILKAKFSDLGLKNRQIRIIERCNVLDWRDAIGQIAFEIEKHNIKLVIVDTLAAFWNVKDENSAASITGPYQLFQGLIQRNNVAGILIHHLRKSGGEDGSGVRGSNAILAAVDVTVEMERDSETKRKISVQSRYSNVAKEQFIVELRDGKYTHLGAKDEFSSASVKSRALAFLASHPDRQFTPETLRVALLPIPGLTTAKNVLEELFTETAIQRTGKGVKGDVWKYQAFKTAPIPAPKIDDYQAIWAATKTPSHARMKAFYV